MKKLFLLLAGLAVMTACNETKPAPTPTPTPGGDPKFNQTEVEMSTFDTVHLFIENAPEDGYELTTTDMYMLQAMNEEFTVFQALAFGEVTISTEIDGEKHSCKFTIKKTVADDKEHYNLPLLTWGASIEAVKLDADKTGKYIEEATEKGVTFVRYELNAPTIAPKGQFIEYAFKDNKLFQSMIIAQYNTKAESNTAWAYTVERSFYYGQDENNKTLAHAADRPNRERYYIFGESIEGEDETPVLIMFFIEPPKEDQSVISKTNACSFVESPMAKKLTPIAGPLQGIRTL